MKKFLLILCLLLFCIGKSFAEEVNYEQIYFDTPVPSFSYVHSIDPGQYYDNKDATYSVYPLFRLSTTLYFKTIAIAPGYYALTPREYKGQYYMLFKDCGQVKYIVPVYQREMVPEGFYDSHLPKPKLTLGKKISTGWYSFIGKHFKSAKRTPQVKSYIEVDDLDDKFVSIIIYFGDYRYYTIFRTVQM